ncbi:hypothetical protein ABW21_db0209876 [Orbilia brochopaga]|nr:hypothetical protein ABW21_db0209876 [Drechslerella brochopaga]
MFTSVVVALMAAALYFIWSQVDLWTRERRFKKLFGTKKPRHLVTNLPFGVDHLSMVVKQAKRQDLPEFYRWNYDEFGDTFVVKMIGSTTVSTRDPRNIQALLATRFRDFGVEELRKGTFRPLIGVDGIFSVDNQKWEHARALLRPQFSRQQISQLEDLEDHVRDLAACMPDGEVVELQALFFELTMDTATHFLFGESTNILAHRESTMRGNVDNTTAEPQGNAIAHAFDNSQVHLLFRSFLKGFHNWHNPKDLQDSVKLLHDLTDSYVYQAIRRNKTGDLQPGEKPGKYVFLQELVKDTQDPLVLRSNLLSLLLAGRDTTACLLGWTFYALTRNPEVEQKLRAAIERDFGNDTSRITFESLKNCKYLQWVMDESLRLYPPVPINRRAAVRDTWLPTGGGPEGKDPIFVPKGAFVEHSAYAMHRRADIWGDDANWFRPERWGEGRSKGFHWEYLPFNGGPRICLGQQYALTEAGYTIVRLFQTFRRFESAEKNEFTRFNVGLAMSVGGEGVKIRCYRD